MATVYPRGHGESKARAPSSVTGSGLSPWARGILSMEPQIGTLSGSIPVGTGNPVRS